MRSPRPLVSVDALRYAAARAVERSSLRKVADEMGMAPSWLDGFIDGRVATPRSKTLRKLREWFVRQSASLAEVSEDSAGAALSLLVAGLPDEPDRRRAAGELVEALARAYGRHGALPAWLKTFQSDAE